MQPPIAPLLPEILDALRARATVVVHAPTGAGKTTALPPAILDDGLAGDGAIWVLEPRRVAARAAARFVARNRGSEPGAEVGWHVRFDPCFSRTTRLLYLTTGVAVRRISDDPFLEGVNVVLVDELHERALDLDLAVAFLRRIQQEVRPDLRLVLMSATLDGAELAAQLGDAPLLHSAGRTFPVDVRYLPHPTTDRASIAAARAIRGALIDHPGDVLTFLPGTAEIRETAQALSDLDDLDVLPLHGALPPDAQDRALVPGPRRRVVLATNVAETSLTLEGIQTVVDTGTARIARTDPASGLQRLVVEPISRAAAEQRAGRAGRTAPGVALRLWTEREHRGRPAFDEPEIRRADLAGVVLQLRAWGEPDPAALPWIEPPPPPALDAAEELLRALALTDARGLTALGRRAATLPLHPRLAVLLLHTADAGYAEVGAFAAAILAGRDPRRRRDPATDPPTPTTDCDVHERVIAVRAGRDPSLHHAAAREVTKVARQLLTLVTEHERADSERPARAPGRETEGTALRRAILAAWPDRLAMRRGDGSDRALLRTGRGVRSTPSSGVREADLFVAVVIDDGPRREGLVRLASAVDRDWLQPVTTEQVRFDAERRLVIARAEERVDAIVLSSRPLPAPDPMLALDALLSAVRADPSLLPYAAPEVDGLLARIELLSATCPELELPAPDARWLDAALPAVLTGRRSLEGLDGPALADALLETLPWTGRRDLDAHAPTHLPIPSGRSARLTWARGSRPILAVRIQELFGMQETPRIARGRVPVLLHLLAPNGRPAQITDDLQSFWSVTWHDVRRDLRARYPKHDWPEDPTTATASTRPRRRTRDA